MYNENVFVKTLISMLKQECVTTDKIHIQKFTSFLSDNNENVPFRFNIHIFGPFSRELEATLNTMALWENLTYCEGVGYSVNSDSSIKSLPKEISDQLLLLVKRFKGILNEINIVEFSKLELFGTMHYYMCRTVPLEKEEVFKKFEYAKEDKFSRELLNKAYNILFPLFK